VSVIVCSDAKIKAAIGSIPKDAWTTVEYADAVDDQTTRLRLDVTSQAGRCLHGVTTYPVGTPTDTGGEMEHTTRIPPAEITGVKGALIKRMIERKLGKVPTAVGVYWHNPRCCSPASASAAHLGDRIREHEHAWQRGAGHRVRRLRRRVRLEAAGRTTGGSVRVMSEDPFIAHRSLLFTVAYEQQQVVERFLAALTTGDVPGLLEVLAPDVLVVGDGGGLAYIVDLNGGIAARIDPGGENDTAVSFVIDDGRITQIYAIRNPHKLKRLSEAAELRR
jgi:ketosteroid isomerase-like protein